jgi:hypothetical protein
MPPNGKTDFRGGHAETGFCQRGKIKMMDGNVEQRNRMMKSQKDIWRLDNARHVGMVGNIPHPDSAYKPQLKQLQMVALERNGNLKCQSWSRQRLLEWLTANPLSSNAPIGTTNLAMQSGSPICASLLSPGATGGGSSSSTKKFTKFRWNKNMEARAVAAICKDTEGFMLRERSLSRDRLDAKATLSDFWITTVDVFNSPDFNPGNEFDHIGVLQYIDPRNSPACHITGTELQAKFKAVQSLVTKAVNNFNISGGGKDYGVNQSEDINITDYDWGVDNGIVSITESGISSAVNRINECLKSFGIATPQLQMQAEVCIKEMLYRAKEKEDDEEFNEEPVNLILTQIVQGVLVASVKGKIAVAVSVLNEYLRTSC